MLWVIDGIQYNNNMIRIDRIYTDTHDSVHDRRTSSFDDKVLYEKL